MHPSVSEAWPVVAREHEGVCAWPYLDTVGKVTAGIGTLLDEGGNTPPESYLGLPWTTGGRVATRAEAASAWLVVKSRVDLAPRGGYAFREVTTLRLDDRTIDGLLTAKTLQFWSQLSSQLVDLEDWPADAQLALIDMAYQLGPYFMGAKWPNFTAAAHSSNFAACALHCAVRQASQERNAHRVRLFNNAAAVELLHIDPAILWDKTPPEVDMQMTPEEYQALVDDVAAEVIARLPKFPTPTEIARKVLTLDGEIENVVNHPQAGSHMTLATAIEVIAEGIK